MILIDTSVWIDYFRDGKTSDMIDYLIDNADVCINDVIRAELLPMMIQRNERELEMLLSSLPCLKIHIDWDGFVSNFGYSPDAIKQVNNELKILKSFLEN